MNKNTSAKALLPAVAWTLTAILSCVLLYLRPQSESCGMTILLAVLGAVNAVLWWKTFFARRRNSK